MLGKLFIGVCFLIGTIASIIAIKDSKMWKEFMAWYHDIVTHFKQALKTFKNRSKE